VTIARADKIPAGPLPIGLATPVDLGEIPAELAGHFDLGRWESAKVLAAGKSQHYILTTDRGRFVVRRSYRAKEADGVRFEHELVDHLRANGFPGPEFVLTVDGEPYAAVDGRIWRTSVFVEGRPGDSAHPGDVEAIAGALASYHRLVDGFTASVPVPAAELVVDALARRVADTVALLDGGARPVNDSQGLLASLEQTLADAQAVLRRLQVLYAAHPLQIIHGGCRRGSALFRGDTLAVVIDFDSAHLELRALDLAVGVHDFAKVYGDPGSADYKVHLDPAVAARFVSGYQADGGLSDDEVEAVPQLLMAKRLKRALGRYARLLAGEALSDNDHRKIALELARVRSLTERPELVEAMREALR
jgi:homoserine kinase type II